MWFAVLTLENHDNGRGLSGEGTSIRVNLPRRGGRAAGVHLQPNPRRQVVLGCPPGDVRVDTVGVVDEHIAHSHRQTPEEVMGSNLGI